MARNLDESELPDRHQLRDGWMALVHPLDRYEGFLVGLPTRWDHQVDHKRKARSPDHPRPKQYVHRVHARPRHDR